MKAADVWFYRGIAAGLAAVVRLHDQPSMVADVLHSLGVTMADLCAADVDEFDKREIRKAFASLIAGKKRAALAAGKKS